MHTLRSLADCRAIIADTKGARRALVIGASFIGLEVAATARKLGLDVSVVEVAPVPLTRVLGTEAGAWFRDYHVNHGVNLYCGVGLAGVDVADGGTKLTLSGGPSPSRKSREVGHSLARPILQTSPVQAMWSGFCPWMSSTR